MSTWDASTFIQTLVGRSIGECVDGSGAAFYRSTALTPCVTSCEYLAEKFGGSKEVLSSQCVCICDDDNDVEMALSCSHAFIPSISSDSMLATIQEHPSKFTLTSNEGTEGVRASEAALDLILERIEAM